jgi:selenocysteine-specific translation elongation factor
MFIKDKYPVTFLEVGRSRKDHCLVDREYIKKDGVKSIRKSITYNPFLKTKLIGVLGTSFLRGRVTLVDGARMSTAKRLELASSKGFVSGDVETFLRSTGHEVIIENSQFAQEYYNYKNRLNNHPVHKDKTEHHKHNMAIRFMIKRFLVVLYREWRKLEKLPIASEYSEGKLGMIHKTAT